MDALPLNESSWLCTCESGLSVYSCGYLNIYIYIYIHTYIDIYVYTFVYDHILIYVYIYIYIQIQLVKGQLADGIAAAETKDSETAAAIEEAANQKVQLGEELKAHKADRESAKKSVASATSLREKEAKSYADSTADLNQNSAAIKKAVAALEKGATGFLQTSAAQTVQKLVETRETMADIDRQTILAFLSGGAASAYTPQSGQITGILKQIGDEMAGSLAEETAAEEAAIQSHAQLVAAKTKEIGAHTKAIEEKSIRVGEVAVAVANMSAFIHTL